MKGRYTLPPWRRSIASVPRRSLRRVSDAKPAVDGWVISMLPNPAGREVRSSASFGPLPAAMRINRLSDKFRVLQDRIS